MQPVALVVSTASIAMVSFALYRRFYSSHRIPKRMFVEDIIAERRSIFPQDYDSTRKVPKGIIDKMLASANWAPTHARTEPWRFIVFSSESARRELGELEASLYKENTPLEKFSPSKHKKKLINKLQADYVIAICMKRQESERLPEIEEVCAVACAVQNMHLTAASYEVGGYWSSGTALSSQKMKSYLALGEKDKCLGMFYVGYPSKKPNIGRRRPIDEKVEWR